MKDIRTHNGTNIEKCNGDIGSYTPRWYVLTEGGERLKRFSTLKGAKKFIEENK
jgi:hypothetical protein